MKPAVILNAAAYTAVDRAESEPELAHAINAMGPRILAEEALNLNAPVGIALLSLTMFAAGYGVAGDPIYSSRIEQALADTSAIDLRITSLHRCATGIIRTILEDITGAGLKREAE